MISKLPWAVERGYEQSERGTYIVSADGGIVAAEQDGTDCVLTPEDAAFIVACCNSRDDADYLALAAECKRLSDELDAAKRQRDHAGWVLNEIRNMQGGGRLYNRAAAIVTARYAFKRNR